MMARYTERDSREFVCRDCGIPTVVIIPTYDNDQELCATCTWIRTIDDPQQRAELRHFLKLAGDQ